jgi:hypothetical protein
MPAADQLAFLSLLFDEQLRVLTAPEIAQRLRICPEQVVNLVDSGRLAALDLSGAGASRRCLRIPSESFAALAAPAAPPPAVFPSLTFPSDRRVLNSWEIGWLWRVSHQHVLDLIAEGELRAVNVGANERRHWRVPVEGYNEFLTRRLL